jgi:hypothetical protein
VTAFARPFAFGLAALCILGAGAAQGDGFRLRTDYALTGAWSHPASLDTALGFENRTNGSGNARLIWEKSLGDFRIEAQSRLSFSQGDTVAYATALAPFMPAPVPSTLFDLTRSWQSNANTTVTNTIDRLSVAYASPHVVLKIGRQAITWGNGLVFHPTDIVAPFSPGAIDTSYKPGADMIYAQYLFDSGADLQLIAVPRGASPGGPIAFTSSTYALRARAMLGPIDTGLMLARDRGDSVATLSLGGPLAGASWNVEYAHWALASGTAQASYLANISNFGTLFNRNISYYAEYFHNGFGVANTVALDSLPASLSKRLSTGQVFNLGQDYLALGAQVELSADLSLAPNAVINLTDGSALAGVVVNYTLDDNTNAVLSYTHPFGAVGTDFGGRETTAGSGIYLRPSRSLTMQLVRYF